MKRLQASRWIVAAGLPAALFVLCTADHGYMVPAGQDKPRGAVEHRTPYYRIALAGQGLLVESLDVDSLGQGKVGGNLLSGAAMEKARLETARAAPLPPAAGRATPPAWEFRFAEKTITLIARHVAGQQSPPLTLRFDQKRSHATVLGRMKPHVRQVATPCLLHVPDHGTFRVTCDVPGQALDYDARRYAGRWVQAAFPPADSRHPTVTYTLEVVSLYPKVAGIEGDRRYDGFRRNYLTIFQVNPRLGVLANNSSSDVCGVVLPPVFRGGAIRTPVGRRIDLPGPGAHEPGSLPGRHEDLWPGGLHGELRGRGHGLRAITRATRPTACRPC